MSSENSYTYTARNTVYIVTYYRLNSHNNLLEHIDDDNENNHWYQAVKLIDWIVFLGPSTDSVTADARGNGQGF